MHNYDVIIVGAGPAGITCSIYLQNSKQKVLLIEKNTPGGRMLQAEEIANYPGVGNVSGVKLALDMFQMVDLNKIEFLSDEVSNIQKEDDYFIVTTKMNQFKAKKVIIASGFINKPLPNTNEHSFSGRGISYCALCDAPLVKQKDVLVYANTKKAFDEIKYLSSICSKIYLVTKVDFPYQIDNVEVFKNATIKKFHGLMKLEKVILENPDIEVKVSKAFIYNGYIPASSFINNLQIVNENGLIEVDCNNETKVKGLYAVGDITNGSVKQIGTAVGSAINAVTKLI